MASDLMNVGATGRYYKVQPNGKAQSGLKEGDRVVTNGGTYQILKVNDDGSYSSALYDENLTTKNYSGKYENSGPYSNALSISGETKSELKEAYDRDYTNGVSKEKYDRISAERPAEYSSAYKEQMERLLDRLENREDFSYDSSSDPLYMQYRESYMNAGKQAMEDTYGQAASLTGGYGNTYAQAAASSAYEGYLQKLGAKIPELYQNARDTYEKEGDELYRLYSLYANADKSDYSRYRDETADWESERDATYREYTDDMDRAQKDYYNRLSLLQDSAKLESSDYWKETEAEADRQAQRLSREKFEYSVLKDSAGKTRTSSSASKGKTVTASLYDSALKAYESGGESSLVMFADKLRGSGYAESGITDVLDYARRYGNAPSAAENSNGSLKNSTSRINSILLDMFNYRGQVTNK